MMRNYSTALEHLNKAYEILAAVLPPEHPDLVKVQTNISTVHEQMSSYRQILWNF